MTRYKIQDINGNRFVVYAYNRTDAKQKAMQKSTANLVYIID